MTRIIPIEFSGGSPGIMGYGLKCGPFLIGFGNGFSNDLQAGENVLKLSAFFVPLSNFAVMVQKSLHYGQLSALLVTV